MGGVTAPLRAAHRHHPQRARGLRATRDTASCVPAGQGRSGSCGGNADMAAGGWGPAAQRPPPLSRKPRGACRSGTTPSPDGPLWPPPPPPPPLHPHPLPPPVDRRRGTDGPGRHRRAATLPAASKPAPADVPARPARRARTDPAEQRRGRRPGGTPSERRRLGCRHVASFQRTRESRTVSTIPRGVHTRSAKKQVKSRYFRY